MTSESRLDCHQILCLMAYSDCTGMGLVQGMGFRLHGNGIGTGNGSGTMGPGPCLGPV